VIARSNGNRLRELRALLQMRQNGLDRVRIGDICDHPQRAAAQTSDLFRYSTGCSKSPVIIPILKKALRALWLRDNPGDKQ